MRKIIFSLLFMLIGASAYAFEPFRWTNVGGDPCSPKAGCNISYALERAHVELGWPMDVLTELVKKVAKTQPETIVITSGLGGAKDAPWRGWMTWGSKVPKFKPDVIAAWPDGQYHPASHWTHEVGDTVYHLIHVRKCGNWGGWKSSKVLEFTTELKFPPEPAAKGEIPLGVVPQVACPEDVS